MAMEYLSYRPIHGQDTNVYLPETHHLIQRLLLSGRQRKFDNVSECWITLSRPVATWDLTDIDENLWESPLLGEIFAIDNWQLSQPGDTNKNGEWEGRRWKNGVPAEVLSVISYEDFIKLKEKG